PVRIGLPEEVGEAAHMVLVAVREEDRADAPSCEVADVREEEVDAEMLVARKCETCVDDEDLAAELVHGHVLADLAEAAERDDAQAFAHSTESAAARVESRAMRRRARAGRAARGSRAPRRAPRPSPRRAAVGGRRRHGREGRAPP